MNFRAEKNLLQINRIIITLDLSSPGRQWIVTYYY